MDNLEIQFEYDICLKDRNSNEVKCIRNLQFLFVLIWYIFPIRFQSVPCHEGFSIFFPKDSLVYSVHKISLLWGLIKAEEQVNLLFLNGLIYSSPFVLFMILAFHVPFFCFLFSLSTTEHKTFFHPNDQPIIVPSDVLQRHPEGCPPKKEFKKKKKDEKSKMYTWSLLFICFSCTIFSVL